MAHKKLKEQYEEDCTKHLRLWELWQISHDGTSWSNCTSHPSWSEWSEYRRKELTFQPEYFSGLNWREVLKKGLVGSLVMVSDDGEYWDGPYRLSEVVSLEMKRYQVVCYDDFSLYTYIRTCPETYTHPTITIGSVSLARPETSPLETGTEYYLFDSTDPTDDGICTWKGDKSDFIWLESGCIHLDPGRRQDWADWWDNTVMKEIHK